MDLITNRQLKKGADLTPRCHGVYALNIDSQRVETLPARAVVLATGGVGKVYRYTSNPDTATGDGIAMAWRAGCRVSNMEFIQFHPTACLYHPQERSFLITEALRGEGAVLKLPNGQPGAPWGERFMPSHDERAELAPRDIVARAIDFEMKKHGVDHVWLDATHLGETFLREHFPTIFARCLSLGIDISKQPIPGGASGGTTPAVAWSPTCPAAPICRACSPWVKPPTRACTAPTAWPAIHCWSAW